jgi:hypothetical protein
MRRPHLDEPLGDFWCRRPEAPDLLPNIGDCLIELDSSERAPYHQVVEDAIEWLEGRFGEQSLDDQSWERVLSVVLFGVSADDKPCDLSTVLVVENASDGQVRPTATASTFATRWEEIVSLGYDDWVNVGPPRVVDGNLTIYVVYRGQPSLNAGTSPVRRYRRETIWLGLTSMHGAPMNYRPPWLRDGFRTAEVPPGPPIES